MYDIDMLKLFIFCKIKDNSMRVNYVSWIIFTLYKNNPNVCLFTITNRDVKCCLIINGEKLNVYSEFGVTQSIELLYKDAISELYDCQNRQIHQTKLSPNGAKLNQGKAYDVSSIIYPADCADGRN